MDDMRVRLHANGVSRTGWAEPRRSLADFLREDLGLTGTHVGCEHGACGACTVLFDGEPVRSCLMFAVQADGREITTVEGLSPSTMLNPLQEAMRDSHAFQCGFCTPGFLTTLTAFMSERPDGASREEMRDYLSGNVCRCSGYQTIIDGVELAMSRRSAAQPTDGAQAEVTP